MLPENERNLTKREVQAYLKKTQCKRVPELDLGFFWAYELPDSRFLLEFGTEGGQVYDSREHLASHILKLEAEAEAFNEEHSGSSIAHDLVEDHGQHLDLHEYTTMEQLEREETRSVLLDGDRANSSQAVKGELFSLTNCSKEELLSSLVYFSQLGFYPADRSTSDQSTLLERIAGSWESCGGKSSGLSAPHLDLQLLRWDQERVWWHELELDVCAGNDRYVSMLFNLAQISRGTFNVQDVSETWESPQGPICLQFVMGQENFQLQPKYLDGWLDLNIIRKINSVIPSKKNRFEIVATGGQSAFVTLLSRSEKKLIKQDRGWSFLT
jgi:hypothetical protein